MTHTPRIIVTNDDGIDSPGLKALATVLNDRYEVIVAAPAVDMSGSGTGIGRFDIKVGVEMERVKLDEAPVAYMIDGPPGLAVTAAALGAFGPKPDMVVSGINAGMNTGHSIIHSGTVGAALTARTFSMKGLAVSLGQSDPWHWETAARVASSTADWLLAREKSPQVLNVNVPGVPLEEVRGIHWADLDEFGYIRVATADIEDHRLQFVVGPTAPTSDPASDTVMCSENFVTLTPLSSVEPAPFPDEDASAVWSP
ncbi:MAG TPA: 5'/3'-nucleotidase SurE [Acidimicrobiia bacterium]|jgi:5'-nucleotidase